MTDCKAPKCGCEGNPQWHEDKTNRLMAHIHSEAKERENLSTERKKQANLEVRIDAALKEVREELLEAIKDFPPFRSAHEGVAIIEEEFLEFRKAAYWPHKTKSKEETEATQLAAMTCRYLIDVCYNEDTPR